jgi:hypothetical protein
MTRIIVELKGGLVQAVWSTDSSIKAEIMDRDLPENDDDVDHDIKQIESLEADIRDLKMMDIS